MTCPTKRKCIVCGLVKDIIEFFYDRVCIDCFPKADKYGRSRKIMEEYRKNIKDKKDD